jgi:hypothetical protein
MGNERTSVQTEPPTTNPRPELTALGERLVGTWKISGGSQGETTYEWMDGCFFLIQRGRVTREGEEFEYVQIIGYDRTPEAGPGEEMVGRLYTSRGDTLRYVCEADDETMTIWFGERGSPAVYRGRWSDDGNTITGAWEWPGGGYEETMTRA